MNVIHHDYAGCPGPSCPDYMKREIQHTLTVGQLPGQNEYGTLTDWTTDQPIRPTTRDEREMTARSRQAGEPNGVWRDSDVNDGRPVYVNDGPGPDDVDCGLSDETGERR